MWFTIAVIAAFPVVITVSAVISGTMWNNSHEDKLAKVQSKN